MSEINKIECYKCKKILAENLVLPKGLCVYCAADESEQLPEPQKQQKTLKKEFLHILMKTVKQEELKP